MILLLSFKSFVLRAITVVPVLIDGTNYRLHVFDWLTTRSLIIDT